MSIRLKPRHCLTLRIQLPVDSKKNIVSFSTRSLRFSYTMSVCESAAGVGIGPEDIGAQLKKLEPKTLVLHWGEAYPNTTSENNALVVTARNQRFEDGILVDGWRRAGRLFWCPVKKDDEYEVEQHYGHSGITMWRENMKWSAWLQDYATAEQTPKTASASR